MRAKNKPLSKQDIIYELIDRNVNQVKQKISLMDASQNIAYPNENSSAKQKLAPS